MRSCRFGHLFRIAHPTVAATPLSRSTDVDHNKFRIRFRLLAGIPNKVLAYMNAHASTERRQLTSSARLGIWICINDPQLLAKLQILDCRSSGGDGHYTTRFADRSTDFA